MSNESKTIHQKMMEIQKELKAPKGQFNKFGKYHYRSCEDITEAIKPLLDVKLVYLKITDSMELVGDRYYIKATAAIVCAESGEAVSVEAFARESLAKKGMDDSQITGTASSYARKYALNGLLAIDDTKDADTQDNSQPQNIERLNVEQVNTIYAMIDELSVDKPKFLAYMQAQSIEAIQAGQYDRAIAALNKKRGK